MAGQHGEEFDLVVVGCGIAGCSAAAAATQKGLSVAVLERAPKEQYGGNTRYTDSNWRMKNEEEISDDFESHLADNANDNLDFVYASELTQPYARWPSVVKSHPFTDPEIISTLASNAPRTLKWLGEFKIKFETTPNPLHAAALNAPRMRAVGGGIAMIEALSEYARQHGAEFFYEHTAYKLILDDAGRVCGVFVKDNSGLSKPIRGKAVVLASGGFEGNPHMMGQHVDAKAAPNIRPVSPGGSYNKGEGIRMALEIGAAPGGDYSGFHAQPLDPRSKGRGSNLIYQYSILVNNLGQRFTDEAPGTRDDTGDYVTSAIGRQPRGTAYAVFDSKINNVPGGKGLARTEQPEIAAETLEELAEKLAIPAEALVKTVREYNAGCVGGTFNPVAPDHLATKGLTPPKSNWARPIDTGPYGAFPIICTNCFTFGGLKANGKAQVLDNDGRPIAGLYVAGETMGIYNRHYTGATSVMRGAVFGRIAALTHAASLGKA